MLIKTKKIIFRIDLKKRVFYLKIFNKVFCYNGYPNMIFESIYDKIPNDYRYVCIVKQDMGELYLLANFYDLFKSYFNTDKIFFVFGRKYHPDIFRMYYGEIDYVVIDDIIPKLWNDVPEKVYAYKDKKFILYVNQPFTRKQVKVIKSGRKNVIMLNEVMKHYGIDRSQISFKDPTISATAKDSLLLKLKDFNLNLDKFIILCPESVSLTTYDKKFWQLLANRLVELGYDVFNNTFGDDFNLFNTKFLPLPVEEFVYLASMSKGVISIRTGLVEVLSPLDINLFVLYTSFPTKMTASQSWLTYSLFNYPNIHRDKIFEYNTDVVKSFDILEDIINKIV